MPQATTTYRIERAERVRVGKDEHGTVLWEDRWHAKKGGLTKERAEELVASARINAATSLATFRIVEETPVETPAAAPVATAADLQDARTARAMREMGDYSIRAHDGSWIVTSPKGDSYLVNADTCTCSDWTYRCSKVAAKCKHQVFAAHALFAEGVLLEADTPGPSCPADLARPVRFVREAVAA